MVIHIFSSWQWWLERPATPSEVPRWQEICAGDDYWHHIQQQLVHSNLWQLGLNLCFWMFLGRFEYVLGSGTFILLWLFELLLVGVFLYRKGFLQHWGQRRRWFEQEAQEQALTLCPEHQCALGLAGVILAMKIVSLFVLQGSNLSGLDFLLWTFFLILPSMTTFNLEARGC